MHITTVSQQLETFSSWYQGEFPASVNRLRLIGLEKEYPVTNKDGEAGDIRVVFPDLIKAGWEPVYDDYYRDVVLAVRKYSFEVTTDAGWCTLEISGPPITSILEGVQAFARVEQEVVHAAARHGLMVLGYGIQPLTLAHQRLWIIKRRHEVIRRVLPPEISAITVTASDQVHVDFARHELVDAINVFNALTGVVGLFFGNSPIHGGGIDELGRHVVREDSWRHAGIERSGIPEERFESDRHLMAYLLGLDFLIAKTATDYETPQVPFFEWMEGQTFRDWQHGFMFHEASVWLNARPRVLYKTVEMRAACSQRAGEHAQLAALMMGLAEMLPAVKALVCDRGAWSYWHSLKSAATMGHWGMPPRLFMSELLRLADEGLRRRGLHEEVLLPPLWDRLEERRNPASEALHVFERGGLSALIDLVAIKPE